MGNKINIIYCMLHLYHHNETWLFTLASVRPNEHDRQLHNINIIMVPHCIVASLHYCRWKSYNVRIFGKYVLTWVVMVIIINKLIACMQRNNHNFGTFTLKDFVFKLTGVNGRIAGLSIEISPAD